MVQLRRCWEGRRHGKLTTLDQVDCGCGKNLGLMIGFVFGSRDEICTLPRVSGWESIVPSVTNFPAIGPFGEPSKSSK